MKEVDICVMSGLTDFYSKSETELRKALESAEDFDTGWWESKMEERYARIVKEGQILTVTVECCMDELDDLIYDARWEVDGLEELIPTRHFSVSTTRQSTGKSMTTPG